MAVEQSREATFGILTYLLLGAAIGASTLLGTFFLGLDTVGDAIGAGLHDRITTGEAQATILLAFFVAAPFFALIVAALMGMRGAQMAHDVSGPAAATTVFGLPILWVNLAVGLLLSSALLDWTGSGARFDAVFDLVVESILFLVLATAATVVFAAILANILRDAFLVGELRVATRHAHGHGHAHEHHTPPLATHADEPVQTELPEPRTPSPSAVAAPPEPRAAHGTQLVDYPVECPRCQASFQVSGERPVRIQCPECGKTGTIR